MRRLADSCTLRMDMQQRPFPLSEMVRLKNQGSSLEINRSSHSKNLSGYDKGKEEGPARYALFLTASGAAAVQSLPRSQVPLTGLELTMGVEPGLVRRRELYRASIGC